MGESPDRTNSRQIDSVAVRVVDSIQILLENLGALTITCGLPLRVTV
jgi:hypothetical protein